jgi:ABC-type nitrate/sulfonate/bicarbonate transport system substrate-binding protein
MQKCGVDDAWDCASTGAAERDGKPAHGAAATKVDPAGGVGIVWSGLVRLIWAMCVTALLMCQCAPAAQPAPTQAPSRAHLVVGMPVTPPNLPHVGVYLAQELGYFGDEGLDVEIKSFESGVQVLRGGISGGLDVIGSSSEPVIAATAQGANLKVIYSYAHALTVSLVVQDDIHAPADLRGKNTGVQDVGSFREIMTRVVLQRAGLTQQDVRYVPLASANYISALVAGQIDTAILHVDQALNAQQRKAGLHQLVNLWDLLPDYFYGTFVMAPDKMQADPTLAPRFVKAVMRAHRFIYTNKDRTVQLAAKLTNVAPEIVSTAYDQLVAAGAWPVNDGMPTTDVEHTITTLHDLGLLQPNDTITPAQLVDRGPAEVALKELGGPMTGDARWK